MQITGLCALSKTPVVIVDATAVVLVMRVDSFREVHSSSDLQGCDGMSHCSGEY